MFQSTHPHGVRQHGLRSRAVKHMFQSTHPHGVRLILPDTKMYQPKFQSTHPHGVRHDFRLQPLCKLDVSIHAPTRGATGNRSLATHPIVVSIHAPTRGATCRWSFSCSDCNSFNPRTHTGCDLLRVFLLLRLQLFQSTHPHGVRRGNILASDFL